MPINKVFLSGNLTRDPEERMTQGGMAIVTFGIAVNDRRKNQSTGEYEDAPNFFDCTMFGKRGSYVASRISKGSKVALEGRLRWSQWERDGQKRSKVEVLVDEVEFQSSAKGGGRKQEESEPEYVEASIWDEDIPF